MELLEMRRLAFLPLLAAVVLVTACRPVAGPVSARWTSADRQAEFPSD
jgi:Flp pilus assembly pilin Flp